MMEKMSDIVKINTRFCRSININQDLGNADILAGFICPASSEIALLNIAENVYATGQAAFTWTGPYGSGKSSLALFLSALIGKDKKLRALAQSLFKESAKEEFYSKIKVNDGWEILPIIGDKQDPAILLKEAIEKKQGKKCTDILKSIQEIADTSDGLLIFIDEMGKCLESAAKGQGDVYLFQQLAEYVSRSNGKIILIRMRFGIDSEEYSLESIAQIKSVTRQRIQQVEVKALDKLRQLARSVLKVERP